MQEAKEIQFEFSVTVFAASRMKKEAQSFSLATLSWSLRHACRHERSVVGKPHYRLLSSTCILSIYWQMSDFFVFLLLFFFSSPQWLSISLPLVDSAAKVVYANLLAVIMIRLLVLFLFFGWKHHCLWLRWRIHALKNARIHMEFFIQRVL